DPYGVQEEDAQKAQDDYAFHPAGELFLLHAYQLLSRGVYHAVYRIASIIYRNTINICCLTVEGLPSVGAGFQSRPGVWVGGTRRFAFGCLYLVLPIPPHFFGLAQRNGVEPQRKTLMGWWRPREVSGPTRLSHSRGRCHSAAKVSASRTDWITRPKGEGLGLDVDWRLKVFCPAFLQKSGRGPGAEPWPRAAARGTLLCSQSAGGGNGGTLAGGSPFAGGPRRPQPSLRRQRHITHPTTRPVIQIKKRPRMGALFACSVQPRLA